MRTMNELTITCIWCHNPQKVTLAQFKMNTIFDCEICGECLRPSDTPEWHDHAQIHANESTCDHK